MCIFILYVRYTYNCWQKRQHTLRTETETYSQFSIRKTLRGFFKILCPDSPLIYICVSDSTKCVTCALSIPVGAAGGSLCAAGEHDLHTGWIMNKRATCRRTGTLRIRHELPAVSGNTWEGMKGARGSRQAGVWLVPLQCQVEHCAQLLGKYCDFIWVRLTLSLKHATYERFAKLDKEQGRAAYVCMRVCVCGPGKCVFQFHLICLSTQSEMSESN